MQKIMPSNVQEKNNWIRSNIMLTAKRSPILNLPRLESIYKHSNKPTELTLPTELTNKNHNIEEIKDTDEIEQETSTDFDNYVDVGAISDDEIITENQEDVLSVIQPEIKSDSTIVESTFERRLACPNGCGNFFYVKAALQKHIRFDCGKVYPRHTFRYKCAYCDSRSEYSYSIMRHISKHHRMQKVHVIDTWLKKILEKKETPKKIRETNDPPLETNEAECIKRHECPNKCGITFDHVSNISRHIRKTCTKVQRYLCPYCKYRTRTYNLIKKHIEINHKLSKICAINVFTKQIVYKEMRRRIKLSGKKNDPTTPEEEINEGKKTNKRFQCPNKCGMTFNFQHTMENHQRFVCGKMRYKCPYCSKKCRQEWGTVTHIKHRHPERKVFVIDFHRKQVIYEIAGSKYTDDFDSIQNQCIRNEYEKEKNDSTSLRTKKEQSRTYKCPFCGKMCKHGWNLDQHIKFRHPNLHQSSRNFPRKEKKEIIHEISPQIENSDTAIFSKNTITENETTIIVDETKIDNSSNTKQKRDFYCPNNCGSLIKYEHNLPRHLRNVCGKHKNLECPFCSFRCKNNIVMNKHIKHSHAREENFVLVGDEKNEFNQVDVKVEEIEIDNALE